MKKGFAGASKQSRRYTERAQENIICCCASCIAIQPERAELKRRRDTQTLKDSRGIFTTTKKERGT